ncbi:MAG: N-acetylglucosamine-6-phosphate deacetylase [Pseudomonadota bacterium]
MSVIAYTGARVFDGTVLRDGALVVEVGQVVVVGDVPAGAQVVTLQGGVIVPGFVDLQVNGGGGVMLGDAPSVETLQTMARAHAGLGATTILPTLITDTPEVTAAAIAAVAQAVAEGVKGIAGLHLEGPHLSVARNGAHDVALIRAMTEADEAMLIAAAKALPLLKITVAPESVSPYQIRRLTAAGIIVSLGHSDCSYEAAWDAIASGATCVTHLFNAMSPLTARAPGLVGAALSGPVSAGLIADCIHVHPATMRAACAAKLVPGGLFLVSDAMATAGSEIDTFTLNGREIRRANGRLTLADGTLAGADLDLATAVRNIVALGVDLSEALAMATSRPAKVAALTGGQGTLTSGAPADFVHLGEDLTLQAVWQAGTKL